MSKNLHLLRRKSVWYYHRRFPLAVQPVVGKKFYSVSLNTPDVAVARKLRPLSDLQFDQLCQGAPVGAGSTHTEANPPNSELDLIRRLRVFVEEREGRRISDWRHDPPSAEQREAIRAETGETLQELTDPSSSGYHERLSALERQVERLAGSVGGVVSDDVLAEYLLRAAVEVNRRKLAALNGDLSHPHFDALFASDRNDMSFGELAAELVVEFEEEALANRGNEKTLDKNKSKVALIVEIVGPTKSVQAVTFDECKRVRRTLDKVPANRTKLYLGINLDEAIASGAAEGKPTLSASTQRDYLATFSRILDLGLKKGIIQVNPAKDIAPIRRDTVAADQRRLPLTVEQLNVLFHDPRYLEAAPSARTYSSTGKPWLFWLPLLTLFGGMRPNEACQLSPSDIKKTKAGTWYFDLADEPSDDDEDKSGKQLKTPTSRRRIPVHPELIKIGILKFVESCRKAVPDQRILLTKPDQYGNFARYALKQINRLLRAAWQKRGQSLYSLRHNFRDGLRPAETPPDVLQALGGWSQGHSVADDYGEKSNPDYTAKYVSGIKFPGLDLSHLYH